MRSTSIHQINADKFWQKSHHTRVMWKALYYLMNRMNNAFPMSNVDPKLDIRRFRRMQIRQEIEALDNPTASPSRLLGDLFWKQLNWNQIRQELGSLIVADIGCGSGKYGRLFDDYSGHQIKKYHGYDISPQECWGQCQATHPFMDFSTYDANIQNIDEMLDEATTLITSQSAIEHIENDLAMFSQIRDFVVSENRPTLQVHLFPAASGLRIFKTHGIRQYTPRTVSRISRMFSDFSKCILYVMGNKYSTDYHYDNITRYMYDKNLDYRKNHTRAYFDNLLTEFERDMKEPVSVTGFYALIIHSYPQSDIDYITE